MKNRMASGSILAKAKLKTQTTSSTRVNILDRGQHTEDRKGAEEAGNIREVVKGQWDLQVERARAL